MWYSAWYERQWKCNRNRFKRQIIHTVNSMSEFHSCEDFRLYSQWEFGEWYVPRRENCYTHHTPSQLVHSTSCVAPVHVLVQSNTLRIEERIIRRLVIGFCWKRIDRIFFYPNYITGTAAVQFKVTKRKRKLRNWFLRKYCTRKNVVEKLRQKHSWRLMTELLLSQTFVLQMIIFQIPFIAAPVVQNGQQNLKFIHNILHEAELKAGKTSLADNCTTGTGVHGCRCSCIFHFFIIFSSKLWRRFFLLVASCMLMHFLSHVAHDYVDVKHQDILLSTVKSPLLLLNVLDLCMCVCVFVHYHKLTRLSNAIISICCVVSNFDISYFGPVHRPADEMFIRILSCSSANARRFSISHTSEIPIRLALTDEHDKIR